jgi:hypothetical protein
MSLPSALSKIAGSLCSPSQSAWVIRAGDEAAISARRRSRSSFSSSDPGAGGGAKAWSGANVMAESQRGAGSA